MNVVRHQHIGVNGKLVGLGRFPQAIKVKGMVFLTGENSRSVVTALDDVLRLAGMT